MILSPAEIWCDHGNAHAVEIMTRDDYNFKRGRRVRKKRNHKVKCLRCELIFLSTDLKTNRICEKCKSDYAWRFSLHDKRPMK